MYDMKEVPYTYEYDLKYEAQLLLLLLFKKNEGDDNSQLIDI